MTGIQAPVDGRTARRERNREAVVDALVELVQGGDLTPGLDAVARRAGVSPRSLFRYFDDAEDLTRAAIGRQQSRLAPLLAERVPQGDDLDERVRRSVDDRIALLDAMGPIAQLARLRAHTHAAVATEVARMRGVLRQRLAQGLAQDLRDLPDPETALAAVDVTCSFEAYNLLIDDHGFDHDRAAETLRASVAAIIRDARETTR